MRDRERCEPDRRSADQLRQNRLAPGVIAHNAPRRTAYAERAPLAVGRLGEIPERDPCRAVSNVAA